MHILRGLLESKHLMQTARDFLQTGKETSTLELQRKCCRKWDKKMGQEHCKAGATKQLAKETFIFLNYKILSGNCHSL